MCITPVASPSTPYSPALPRHNDTADRPVIVARDGHDGEIVIMIPVDMKPLTRHSHVNGKIQAACVTGLDKRRMLGFPICFGFGILSRGSQH